MEGIDARTESQHFRELVLKILAEARSSTESGNGMPGISLRWKSKLERFAQSLGPFMSLATAHRIPNPIYGFKLKCIRHYFEADHECN